MMLAFIPGFGIGSKVRFNHLEDHRSFKMLNDGIFFEGSNILLLTHLDVIVLFHENDRGAAIEKGESLDDRKIRYDMYMTVIFSTTTGFDESNQV